MINCFVLIVNLRNSFDKALTEISSFAGPYYIPFLSPTTLGPILFKMLRNDMFQNVVKFWDNFSGKLCPWAAFKRKGYLLTATVSSDPKVKQIS